MKINLTYENDMLSQKQNQSHNIEELEKMYAAVQESLKVSANPNSTDEQIKEAEAMVNKVVEALGLMGDD